jgi:hypothetical protein
MEMRDIQLDVIELEGIVIDSRSNAVIIRSVKGDITLTSERVGAGEYVDFLSRSDLGSQYPKERFEERIGRLVKNAQISLVARNKEQRIVGVCFGLTDFAYWLLVTDLGVDRDYGKLRIGKAMMAIARELSGGRRDIIVFTYANEEAIPFYQRIGMKRSADMMERTDVEWTSFTVGGDCHDPEPAK